MMDSSDLQKTYDYNRVRTSKESDTQWVVNVITDMCYDGKGGITSEECVKLLASLEKK